MPGFCHEKVKRVNKVLKLKNANNINFIVFQLTFLSAEEVNSIFCAKKPI